MNGVSIVETEVLQALIFKIESLEGMIKSTLEELHEAKKPFLTLKETATLLHKSEKWMHLNKHEIGCSKTGGEWLFKRKDIEEYFSEGYYRKKA